MVAARNEDLQIRNMEEEDLHDVLYIERGSYGYPWSEGIFRDCLRAGYSCCVIEENECVAGFAIIQFIAGEAHLLNLCVDVARRRRGIARALLHGLFSVMQYRGMETVYLEVRPSNKGAVRLYESEGFNEIGMRPNYYRTENGKEDALIMAAQIIV